MYRLRDKYLNLVSEELVKIQKELKLTQRQLAELTGIHQPQIARIITRKHELRLNNLEAIANLLGYDIELDIKFVKRDK